MFDFRNLKNCLKKSTESLPRIDAAEIQAQLSAWTEKVRQADVKKLIRDQLKIEKLFSRENYLIPFFEDSKTMVSLVKYMHEDVGCLGDDKAGRENVAEVIVDAFTNAKRIISGISGIWGYSDKLRHLPLCKTCE